MLKSISSIVAFTVTFGFSAVLVGLLFGFPQLSTDYTMNYSSQTRYNIEQLISQDIRNGEMRNLDTQAMDLSENGKLETFEYAESVNEYVDNSQSMDDSGLPSDFQNAWQNHMKAWRDYSNFLNKRKFSSHQMSDYEFDKYDNEFNSEINRTWYKTLRIGKKYGANYVY